MTRTLFYTATTLDGFLADDHDSLDWLFTQEQEEGGALDYAAFIAGVGAVCMGDDLRVAGAPPRRRRLRRAGW